MSKNGTETIVTSIPQCDIHAHVMNTPGVPALYDARTLSGSWGYVCQECFDTFTSTRLGTGYGQRLILQGEVEPRAYDGHAFAGDGPGCRHCGVKRAYHGTDELADLRAEYEAETAAHAANEARLDAEVDQ